jgi:hypothetical protein
MVTKKIFDYPPSGKTFHLSKEKSQYLIIKNNVYGFSVSMQWIRILAQVEDLIINCFYSGG